MEEMITYKLNTIGTNYTAFIIADRAMVKVNHDNETVTITYIMPEKANTGDIKKEVIKKYVNYKIIEQY